MISSDMLRGIIDILILSCLVHEPSYGYQISKTIADHSNNVIQIKETTLYSAFRRLEKNGDIASFQGDVSYGRARTYYRLTEQGRRNWQRQCDDWQQITPLVSAFISNPPPPPNS